MPNCPYCKQPLTTAQIATALAQLRRTFKGGPKPKAKRCACGEMTLDRARKRNHKCFKVKISAD